MRKFNNINDLIAIKFAYDDHIITEEEAFFQGIGLLLTSEGTFKCEDNKLLFVSDYDYTAYQYSSSIIGSNEIVIEKKEAFIKVLNEELKLIEFLVERTNRLFKAYDPIILEVFVDKHINNLNWNNISLKFGIAKKTYYEYIATADYLFKAVICIKSI